MAEWSIILRQGEQVTFNNHLLMSQDFLRVVRGDHLGLRVEVTTHMQSFTFTSLNRIVRVPLWGGQDQVIVRFDGAAYRNEVEFLGFHFSIFVKDDLVQSVTITLPQSP